MVMESVEVFAIALENICQEFLNILAIASPLTALG